MNFIITKRRNMLEEFAKQQPQRIKEFFAFLEDERVVINKDSAFKWIVDIGITYDQNYREPEDLMRVIDELVAYAQMGLEKPE